MMTFAPCSRCEASDCPWDSIEGTTFCPDCMEGLADRTGDTLFISFHDGQCIFCREKRVVSYSTLPLQGDSFLEMSLCRIHLKSFVGRKLTPKEVRKVDTWLHLQNLSRQRIFMLHEVFYSAGGQALQPVLVKKAE